MESNRVAGPKVWYQSHHAFHSQSDIIMSDYNPVPLRLRIVL